MDKTYEKFADALSDIVNGDGSATEKAEELKDNMKSLGNWTDLLELLSWYDPDDDEE